MDARRLKALALCWLPGLVLGLIAGAALAALLLRGEAPQAAAPDPRRIADTALVSVRDHGRMTVLSARYVAIVSASETRLGIEARRTLVLPARVRYGLDLARLRHEHVAWDDGTRTLSITLPQLEISVPEIDMEEARQFTEGGMLLALTGTESELDQANLRQARQDLLRQARQPAPLTAAREAAMRAVARAFALPLRAAGIEASVSARFVDPEGRDEAVHLDRAARIEDVVNDRQAGASAAEGKDR